MRTLLALALASLLLVHGHFASAQATASGASAQAVAQTYMDLMRTRGMSAVADLLHPEEIARFREMVLPTVVDPAVPDSEARRALYFGAATEAEVVALPPLDFIRGLLKFADQYVAENVGGDVSTTIIGSVSEGAIEHVLMRATVSASGVQVTSMQVVSLKPLGDSWGVMLAQELEGVAIALSGAAGQARRE